MARPQFRQNSADCPYRDQLGYVTNCKQGVCWKLRRSLFCRQCIFIAQQQICAKNISTKTRRDFLKLAATLSGAAGLSGVTPDSNQRAYAIAPESRATFPDAEHILILMRSP
ncbi:MAG: twin-arginine translocation signal domain-containing protein [Acidobacteriaceae bacterium]